MADKPSRRNGEKQNYSGPRKENSIPAIDGMLNWHTTGEQKKGISECGSEINRRQAGYEWLASRKT